MDDHGLDANSMNNIVRIFDVTGSNVTLKNLVLKNANIKSNDGGAITNTGQSLTINDVTFIKNKAHYGGAIQNYGTRLTIINSDFTNNQVSSCGGAINNNADKSSIKVSKSRNGKSKNYTYSTVLPKPIVNTLD